MASESLSPEVYQVKPPDFDYPVHATGCFCQVGDTFLLLKRASHTIQGNRWGLPGGRVEPGEEADGAIVRELFEETGCVVHPEQLHFVRVLYFRAPTYGYCLSLYRTEFPDHPVIELNREEHIDYRWLSFDQAFQLELMSGWDKVIDCFRSGSNPSASLG